MTSRITEAEIESVEKYRKALELISQETRRENGHCQNKYHSDCFHDMLRDNEYFCPSCNKSGWEGDIIVEVRSWAAKIAIEALKND